MRRLVVGGVIALAGCDAVLGLGEADTEDEDRASTLDAAIDSPSCETTTMPALAARLDTHLVDDEVHGARSILALDDRTTIIVQFATPDIDIRQATLRLQHPMMARGCATGGTACEPCATGTGGQVTVQWLRADWDELATATDRDASGREWAAERASGATDRGTTTASASYVAGMGLEVTIERQAADQRGEWIGGAANTALVITTTAAVAGFASREAGDSCGESLAPTLIVDCIAPM